MLAFLPTGGGARLRSMAFNAATGKGELWLPNGIIRQLELECWAGTGGPATLEREILLAQFFVGEHFVGRPGEGHLASIEDYRTVGQPQRRDGVLLNDDRGDAQPLISLRIFSISSTITGASPS